jgi:hypothetical protein
MFFSDPTAAFANIARGLRPGGRLVFVCWQSLVDNEWVTVPAGPAAQHWAVTLPTPSTSSRRAGGERKGSSGDQTAVMTAVVCQFGHPAASGDT